MSYSWSSKVLRLRFNRGTFAFQKSYSRTPKVPQQGFNDCPKSRAPTPPRRRRRATAAFPQAGTTAHLFLARTTATDGRPPPWPKARRGWTAAQPGPTRAPSGATTHHLALRRIVEKGRRLVGQHHGRLLRQHARQHHPLKLAVAQRRHLS